MFLLCLHIEIIFTFLFFEDLFNCSQASNFNYLFFYHKEKRLLLNLYKKKLLKKLIKIVINKQITKYESLFHIQKNQKIIKINIQKSKNNAITLQ